MGRLLHCAVNPGGVSVFDFTPGDPPTQADLLAVMAKVDELIVALQRV